MECVTTVPCGALSLLKSAFTFEWTIKDFATVCDKVKLSKFIQSPVFPANIGDEYKCYMKLYPNGDKQENAGYLCVFVQYVSQDGVQGTDSQEGVQGTDSENEEEFGIYYPDNEDDVKECDDNKDGVEGQVEFNLLDSQNQVFKHFVTSKDKNLLKGGRLYDQYYVLDKSRGILKDGSITITSEIREETRKDYDTLYKYMKRQFRLEEFDDFEMLLGNDDHSDVVIVVEDQKLPAHKCILSTKSALFAAMFDHDMMENRENVVKITDFTFEVIRELLRFVYTGKVGDIKSLALDLYKAADKYYLDSLKFICEEALCQNLSNKNVFEYLHFTSFHDALKLKASAIDFIALHAEELKPIC